MSEPLGSTEMVGSLNQEGDRAEVWAQDIATTLRQQQWLDHDDWMALRKAFSFDRACAILKRALWLWEQGE